MHRRNTTRYLGSILALGLVASGCGGDDEAATATPPPRAAAAKPNAATAAATTKGGLIKYLKVEEATADEAEASSIRHRFDESDFAPDPTGDSNRDPFRSFVIVPAGMYDQLRDATTSKPAELCKQHKGSNYGLRDLRLVGIAVRGLQRWALFQDSAGVGHTVRQGDCLGSEEALVKTIGKNLVSLEIARDAAAGQGPRTPEVRSIQMYDTSKGLIRAGDGPPADMMPSDSSVPVVTPGSAPVMPSAPPVTP